MCNQQVVARVEIFDGKIKADYVGLISEDGRLGELDRNLEDPGQ